MKEVNTQSLWTFELGTGEDINVPIWVFDGFQHEDRQDSQNLNNNTFHRPPVTSAQCNIGTEKYPDGGLLLNCDDDDDDSQGYGQTKEAFRALIKNDIFQPYTSDNDFRSSNNACIFGYYLNFFDLRYQRNLESAQPIKVEFEF